MLQICKVWWNWPIRLSFSISLSLCSWVKCVWLCRVELSPVPTCSVSTQPSTCRWMRRSPPGSVLSVTRRPPTRAWSLTGWFLSPNNYHHNTWVCPVWEKGCYQSLLIDRLVRGKLLLDFSLDTFYFNNKKYKLIFTGYHRGNDLLTCFSRG